MPTQPEPKPTTLYRLPNGGHVRIAAVAAAPFRSPFNARELAIVAGVLNSYVRIVSAAYRLAPPHTLTTEIEEIQILARMAELAAQEG